MERLSVNLLAEYANKLLTKGTKVISSEEIEQRLSDILGLLVLFDEKDKFLKAYQNHLKNRLLNKVSVSQEAEEQMISKLGVECGANGIDQLTQMMKDL